MRSGGMNLARLGRRIKDQRERRSLRQSDIASALQVSSQAVSKWERGENAPDISVLIGLARLLNVSLEWLLGGTEAESDTFPATVFCSDVSGFAARAGHLPPAELAAWINAVFYSVTEAVLARDGVPVKYVGDGFLAFFTGIDHARRAVEAAVRARWLTETPGLNIVVHAGEIHLGSIGHPEYARPDVIGEAVNTAFLIQPWVAAHCPGGIGATGSVRGLLDEPGRLRRRGESTVLGADAPVEIYEPVETTE
jgi:class 3 adenylate cyclase